MSVSSGWEKRKEREAHLAHAVGANNAKEYHGASPGTYRVDLEVVQPRGREQRLAHHLHMLEPPPSGRLRDLVVFEQDAGVVREPRAVRAHEQHRRAEAFVVQVEALLNALLERRAVEERHVVVHVLEVQVDELLEQVRWGEVLVRRVFVLHI